jgi:HSP20 family protein
MFERTFQLPRGIDADKVKASFKKGVLKIILPKTAEASRVAGASRSKAKTRKGGSSWKR